MQPSALRWVAFIESRYKNVLKSFIGRKVMAKEKYKGERLFKR